MLRKLCSLAMLSAFLLGGSARAGTFGKVVSIGGEASDVALDEPRGVLYVANFTANRIEVMSLQTNTIQTALSVAAQPSALSVSLDGHWLLVGHYGNHAAPGSPTNGLTLIDLRNKYAKQVFVLPDPPLGLAFGADGRALVVTTKNFVLFDPTFGTTTVLTSIAALAAKALPVPAQSFPPNIVAAAAAASPDGNVIWGFGDTLKFRYVVASQSLLSSLYTSTPALAPRTVSVSGDGSFATLGWELSDSSLYNLAQFPNAGGVLNIGTTQIDPARRVIYEQMAPSDSTKVPPPVLQIVDDDNLTIRESLQLPENTAGKSALKKDGSIMYSVSDSGILVLPVGSLNQSPRLTASVEDLVFRGNFCDRTVATQTIVISDPGGNKTPFTISSSDPGVKVSPSSGVTPAVITVKVDPNAFQNFKGTMAATLTLSSTQAVNQPRPIRVLVNSREPNQRGTFIDIPGTLKDLTADPVRDHYYVLRQDKNQVLVFKGSNNTQVATLRTCTTPMSIAITYDRQYLMIGCDNSHYAWVYDLDTFQQQASIQMSTGDYIQSLAASAKAILAVTRDAAGGDPNIHRIDFNARSSVSLPSLGPWENKVPLNTMLSAAPNGATIVGASSDGSVLLYDANVDNFTISRKDFASLSGAVAASSFGQYVIGNQIFDSSLVPTATIQPANGTSSGFLFVDQNGFFISAADSASPGVLARVNAADGTAVLPTGVVEAPVLGVTGSVFTRTLALLPSRSEFVALTTSGITVLPPNYDASVAAPFITNVVSAADLKSPVAPGGLMAVLGTDLSGTNIATNEVPLPTVIGDSCLTVNGAPVHMLFVSPTQVNAQMPAQESGNVAIVMHTPGGVSNTFFLTLLTGAPSVFLTTLDGVDNVPAIVRWNNGLVVTSTNPVHRGDILTIYLTGLGAVNPPVSDGSAGLVDPLSTTVVNPVVKIGGVDADVLFSGLVPGMPGAYVINVSVSNSTPQGLSVPLTITQGDITVTENVRVVQK
ncbi:MAG: hypothetical protein LAP61_08960 [Acidobacteriia bacterium]|nr:hypothetical protein [Terriglobia bacterium]